MNPPIVRLADVQELLEGIEIRLKFLLRSVSTEERELVLGPMRAGIQMLKLELRRQKALRERRRRARRSHQR